MVYSSQLKNGSTNQIIFFLQSTTLESINVMLTSVSKLVYQTIITEYNSLHSFDERFAVSISHIVKILNKARYHHTLLQSLSLTFWNLFHIKFNLHHNERQYTDAEIKFQLKILKTFQT
jgi:hypothetical protein